jgi:hypothetical protein
MVFFILFFKDDAKTPVVTEGEVAEAYAGNVPEDPRERDGGDS